MIAILLTCLLLISAASAGAITIEITVEQLPILCYANPQQVVLATITSGSVANLDGTTWNFTSNGNTQLYNLGGGAAGLTMSRDSAPGLYYISAKTKSSTATYYTSPVIVVDFGCNLQRISGVQSTIIYPTIKAKPFTNYTQVELLIFASGGSGGGGAGRSRVTYPPNVLSVYGNGGGGGEGGQGASYGPVLISSLIYTLAATISSTSFRGTYGAGWTGAGSGPGHNAGDASNAGWTSLIGWPTSVFGISMLGGCGGKGGKANPDFVYTYPDSAPGMGRPGTDGSYSFTCMGGNGGTEPLPSVNPYQYGKGGKGGDAGELCSGVPNGENGAYGNVGGIVLVYT